MSDWLDKLAAEIATKEEQPPKGWMSTIEIQKKFGWKTVATACHFTKTAIKAGKMQMKRFRRKSKTGIKMVPYYGPK